MKKHLLKTTAAMLLFLSFGKPSDAQNATTVYSTVSGTVWKENIPADGTRQIGESGMPGMLVTILDALTDRVIASSVSDSAGHFLLNNYAGVGDYYIKYGYPEAGFTITSKRTGTDNEVNSAADPSTAATDAFTIANNVAIDTLNLGLVPVANKITFCDVKSLSVTDWTTTFNFPKSNDAVTGVLTKVTLFIADAVWHPSIGVENTGAQGITTTLGFSGLLTLTPPTGGANEVTTTLLNRQVTLPAYDGSTDYGGLSGITWHNEFAAIIDQNRTFTTTAQLNVFRGPSGNVSFPTTAQNSFTVTGGGNLENSVQTHVGAGACVTYEYAGGITLPISLTDFSASSPDGVSSLLKWETASEMGNKGFAIERSTNGKNFTEIGFVNTKAGNKEGVSNGELSYVYQDMQALTGPNYYRLKQIDINGQPTYSGVAKVLIGKQAGITVYPNPADRFILINNNGVVNEVAIYSALGSLVLQQKETIGSGEIKIDTSLLPTGTYSLKVLLADGSAELIKIIIKH